MKIVKDTGIYLLFTIPKEEEMPELYVRRMCKSVFSIESPIDEEVTVEQHYIDEEYFTDRQYEKIRRHLKSDLKVEVRLSKKWNDSSFMLPRTVYGSIETDACVDNVNQNWIYCRINEVDNGLGSGIKEAIGTEHTHYLRIGFQITYDSDVPLNGEHKKYILQLMDNIRGIISEQEEYVIDVKATKMDCSEEQITSLSCSESVLEE